MMAAPVIRSSGETPWFLPLLALPGLVAIVALLAAVPGAAAPLVVALCLGVFGVFGSLVIRPTLTTGFVAVMLLSLAAQGNDEGTDALEVLFGLSLVAYAGVWYGTSLLGGRRVVRNGADLGLALYLFGSITVGVAAGALTGTFGIDFRSDLTCLLALSLYFPAREVCVRSVHGPLVLTGVLLVLGVYAAGVNAATLLGALSGATELYEVVDVRVSSGEIPMTASLLLALAGVTAVSARWGRLLMLGVVMVSIGGLILAKSRGPWITAVLGIMTAAVLLPPRSRTRLLGSIVLGSALTIGSAILVLGNEIFLIGIGLLRRLASLTSAATGDISLLNRYAESGAAWSEVRSNPILGYGWGAPVVRYDMIARGTHHWGFIHNGYLWIWHKVGLWGLGLFLVWFVGVGWQGVQSARAALPPIDRALAAGGVGTLLAIAILGFPSNPFAVPDQVLVLTLVLGLVGGIFERGRAELATP